MLKIIRLFFPRVELDGSMFKLVACLVCVLYAESQYTQRGHQFIKAKSIFRQS